MSNKTQNFNQHDIIVRDWFIAKGSAITELHLGDNARQAASAKLAEEVKLDPQHFVVIPPRDLTGGLFVPDHICFKYTNPAGNVTYVWTHEDNVQYRSPTWVDKNKQNVI